MNENKCVVVKKSLIKNNIFYTRRLFGLQNNLSESTTCKHKNSLYQKTILKAGVKDF